MAPSPYTSADIGVARIRLGKALGLAEPERELAAAIVLDAIATAQAYPEWFYTPSQVDAVLAARAEARMWLVAGPDYWWKLITPGDRTPADVRQEACDLAGISAAERRVYARLLAGGYKRRTR